MAEGTGDKSNNNNKKKNQKCKIDFDSMYEQLQTVSPILQANKMFWRRKGNSEKYTCTLCNISVQTSSNLNILKTTVLAHVEDKDHKKKYVAYIAREKNNNDKALCGEVKSTFVGEENTKRIKTSKNQGNILGIVEERSILDIIEESGENRLSIGNLKIHNKSDQSNWRFKDSRSGDKLVDFDTVYSTFEKSNPVIKSSKQFIIKEEDGRHYFCTLCEMIIFNALNANEFRYNLWVHLNEETHRERLPNFSEVQRKFKNLMEDFSNAIVSNLKYHINYFEVGPIFRFVKCSVCQVAVSNNLHRLENHIRGNEHNKMRELFLKGESINEPLSNRTRSGFRKLVVKLEDQFKKDVKYIHVGKVPGYVVCSLCTCVILPTKFYVEEHFKSKCHMNNKTTSDVNRQSKFRIDLGDLMKTLPDDLRDYNIFEEDLFGLTCKRCKAPVAATSYDLYSHIIKERHVHCS